ncbi:MAG: 4Fe-4S dicluster domain-containing protein [Chloroflexi bacterium]|nr:MAG: 4Fe-4S dicluster domain-containing protein [Chloroflexota bacterium]MBL1195431.1 4Fe-4S dicluster domain-containing protein [Chloroflexota bacterium]NOH12714.1 FAD-dependent oxidoreductase [Chloroflexota bacterium]
MSPERYPVIVPDQVYYRQMVKCQAACPVLTDARGYVTAVAQGNIELGYQIARDPNPLSTICGRICGAPCEVACRRGSIGPDHEPVAIRPLKRVVTEQYGPEAFLRLPGTIEVPVIQNNGVQPVSGQDFSTGPWSRHTLEVLAAQPSRVLGSVAVIGAGPSSLATAHDLAVLGHRVEIFEAGPKSGGMIRYGVPIYRMDWEAMDSEVQAIVDLGVNIHYDTRIGETITLEELRKDFDAVFLGIGLMQGRKLNVEGSDLDGVVPAVDMLLNYNLGYQVQLGKRVVVVGGGDVAMDAARTALRLGMASQEQEEALEDKEARLDEEADTVRTALDVARTALRLGVGNVRVIALESWDELPASRFELEEAEEEGIHITPRLGPVRVLGEKGRVTGLEVIDVAAVFDDVGRFNPRFVPGTNQVLECDSVILAIGQTADLAPLKGAEDVEISPRGLVAINQETGQTSAKDVFAGGDVAYGPRMIIHAVRDGHIAALGIEQFIQGRSLSTEVAATWEEIPDHEMPQDWLNYQRTRVPFLPVDRRTGLTQIELGYSEDEAAVQGLRCLECSINTIFDGSKCILCNGCVDVCPWDCLKIVSVASLEGDEVFEQVVAAELGSPSESWAQEENPSVAAMLKDDTACTRCALCAVRCPTGAITMESFRFEEILMYQD